MDSSLPGLFVHGIVQLRTLECVAMLILRDFPDPGIEPTSFPSPALTGRFFPGSATREALQEGGTRQSSHCRLFPCDSTKLWSLQQVASFSAASLFSSNKWIQQVLFQVVKILWFHWPTYRASRGSFLSKFFIYSFGCVRVLVAAHRIFNCVIFHCGVWAYLLWGIWDLSFPTRDQIHVPHIQGGFLTIEPTREVPGICHSHGRRKKTVRPILPVHRWYIHHFCSHSVLKSMYYGQYWSNEPETILSQKEQQITLLIM